MRPAYGCGMMTGLVLAQEVPDGECEEQDPEVSEPLRIWPYAAALGGLAVLALGALENWFGLTDSGDVFGSDAVQYLDAARAMERGDWHSALNPLWSQGYPALIAVMRPWFQAGMAGDWHASRVVNLVVFCFSLLSFVFLVLGLARRRDAVFWFGAGAVFCSAQVCLDQVSRVGPDQLVSGLFFLACGILVRLAGRARGGWLASGFGLVLGLGFLAKAVFLPLGLVMLVVLAGARVRAGLRLGALVPAVLVFAAVLLGYGTALSRAVGHPTLGESGALNYAWHVDRLAKWVHWEGGVEAAEEAWPKSWIARFAQWESRPPSFGLPLHPSVVVGRAPSVYVFHESGVAATYVPYYDPAYWYAGYTHVFRWRYQVIALGKNVGDLVVVLGKMPMFWAVLVVAALLGSSRRVALGVWPVVACALLGVAIYLPVHLEGRYLSAFLAVAALGVLGRVGEASEGRRRAVAALLCLGLAGELGLTQKTVWSRAMHGWSVRDNVEWQAGRAVAEAGIQPGSEVGMISWTANLHCDWAYLAGVRITSEIQSGADEAAFWGLPEVGQREVLERFRAAGAMAVLTWDRPRGAAVGWRQLDGVPMWVYRF